MKLAVILLLLSGCAKPNFSAVSHPRPQGLRASDALSILPPTNVFQVRTNTWITVGPGVEKITNGNLVLSVTVDRITRIQRVPVLYSNGVRIGPRK